jgi:hypothetical protein
MIAMDVAVISERVADLTVTVIAVVICSLQKARANHYVSMARTIRRLLCKRDAKSKKTA